MTQAHTATGKPFEIGVYSFVENTPDPRTGEKLSQQQRIQNLLEEIDLADQVGLDVFGLGEHHRKEYVSSSPEMILSAAAGRTKNIRFTSAVTVLSSDDPVRVFQRFATLDLVSNGRAEIMAGRGSFIESFPLFGYDLNHYNELFTEKLDLLLKIREKENITWRGNHRPMLDGQVIHPRPVQDEMPIWVAVGGTPESVVRAASRGLPMALAIIGGMPKRFGQFADLYRQAATQSGYDPATLQLSVNSHGFIADKRQDAIDISYPSVARVMDQLGRERGWPPMRKENYEASAGLHGANFVGEPGDIIEKILYQHEIFGHQRFMLQLSVGTMPHKEMLHAIELLGTKVAPAVREEIARREGITA